MGNCGISFRMPDNKKRAENFTLQEKYLFLEILQSYVSVIESKYASNSAVVAKHNAWKALTDQYNQTKEEGRPERHSQQIRQLWSTLKKSAKVEYQKKKKHARGTGGGPPGSDPSPLSERVCELIPAEFRKPQSQYDDDAGNDGYVLCSIYVVRIEDTF